MVARTLTLIMSLLIIGCGGPGGGAGDASSLAGGIADSPIQQELKQANLELNASDQYALTAEDLALLKDEGIASEEEIAELKVLSK